MRAGLLRHRVTIQSFELVQDPDTGNIDKTPVAFATDIPADIRPASAREFIEAGINQAQVLTVVTIRYLADIKPAMQIVFGERLFNIEGVLPDPKFAEYVRLPCSEIVQ
jgi:SPP1 family predicted phage head-tail adaptor